MPWSESERRQRRHSPTNPDHREEHQETRSPYEKDRDRILYSTAFRRLAGVTQVVPAREGHVVHNRLTHSLKVAQIGSRLADYLRVAAAEQFAEEHPTLVKDVGMEPAVVETACLIHDLGHPPYGHNAEVELDSILRSKGLPDGFEGNAQSFRIVTQLAAKDLDHPGLDLTRASLNASIKYPWGTDAADKDGHGHKWNYYLTEESDYLWVRKHGPSGSTKTAESMAMDWADDVSYAVHDLDDFYRSGLIPLDRIMGLKDAREQFLDHPEVTSFLQRGDYTREDGHELLEWLESLGKTLCPKLTRPYNGSWEQRVQLHRLASRFLDRFLKTDSMKDDEHPPVALCRPDGTPGFYVSRGLRLEVGLVKKMASVFVFNAPELLAKQTGQRHLVKRLFEILNDAAGRDDKNHPAWNRAVIPAMFREQLERLDKGDLDLPSSYDADMMRARLIVDFIASLNEDQAADLCRMLTGQDLGIPIAPLVR